ncbi:hypothetical protein MWU58_07935 [Flavobacteriaceae bacterium S0825]|uniref:hypothetical protein n=1 Tax=Gaetbulibacter sp. S0825 TaxID=2720084 RepID=UPI0014322791|nr:hypothetical protein [Gaetbulibacter sp. S0825]MCK0109219.1 hypothetical protein [Flavobacteriaceae bacterium S0825]NIX64854.1 hypothetical protein [Gaetbulibacter sp. S0825]
MKKLLLLIVITFFVLSCSTSKQIEKSLNIGNYDQAINDAIGKLRTNKDKKRKSDYILMLEEAFGKVTQRDLQNIDFLKKENNPENYLRIYDAYVVLKNRQERIKPLLPLYVSGKEAKFDFQNYSNQIITYKNNASEQLYQNAKALLNSNNKLDYRYAYDDLSEIENINPNYKDVRQLMDVAHHKGTDFVLVDMINDSRKVIPERLESDLLNFSSYGLNNFWVEYHGTPQDNLDYDYNMQVKLREINISPEQIKERQIIKEKQIVDGKKNLLDEDGQVVKDSLGKIIKVDKLKNIRCEYYEFKQFKATQVVGNVEFFNLSTKQLLDNFPLSSEFIFEHIYATSRGDRRALEKDLMPFLERRAVPFPNEEQMIYDTGEDLKMQLKKIINSYALN